MSAMDDICAYAVRKLDGSGLVFAALVWLPGKADQGESIGLATPTGTENEAAQAMGQAIAKLKKQGLVA